MTDDVEVVVSRWQAGEKVDGIIGNTFGQRVVVEPDHSISVFCVEIGEVRGRVNAVIRNVVASTRIRLDSLVAETGDAIVDNLQAGGPEKKD